MNQAIFNQKPIFEIGTKIIENLKYKAALSEMRRVRLCLHESPEALVHEMINVFCEDTYIRPHRHPVVKAESYHILEGELLVYVFDDSGKVTQRIHLAEKGSTHAFLLRMTSGIWHTPVPRTGYVVFKETFTGPFRKGTDVEYAPWSPYEKDYPTVLDYLKNLAEMKTM